MRGLGEVLERISKGDTDLSELAKYMESKRDKKSGKNFSESVEEILQKIDVFDSKDKECISRIKDLWIQISINPLMKLPNPLPGADGNRPDPQQLLHYISTLNDLIRKIVFYISYETIPDRLRDWLNNSWEGYYIPFHLVFDDELPLMEDRVEILKLLAYSPRAIEGGLVSLEDGLIYRYESKWYWRYLTVILLLAAFAGTTWIIINSRGNFTINLPYLSLAIPNNPIVGWPSSETLFIGWIAILAGIVTHLAVAAAKIQQKEGRSPLISVKYFTAYVSARSGWLLWKLAMALIGFFGIAYAVTSQGHNLAPESAFLVGYSLDSIVEIFGAGMDQISASQVSALKKQLGVTE